MAELTQRTSSVPLTLELGAWLHGVLGSYSQVLFSSSRAVGILLIAATFVVPWVGLAGVATTLVGLAAVRLMRLPDASFRSGILTFNAALVGMGVGALFLPGWPAYVLILVSGVGAVVLTAALSSFLSTSANLPSLTLPFILSMWLLAALAGNVAGLQPVNHQWDPSASWPELPLVWSGFFKALGALFFVPRVDAGILVALALLGSSRIAFLLALVGYAVAFAIGTNLAVLPSGPLMQNLGFNSMLVAVALGGIWFVPGWASFLLAAAGAAITAVLALALSAAEARVGLAPLTVPFVAVVLASLSALRLRTVDLAPKSVDFTPGSPEQNLDYYTTRLARFGAPQAVALSLPFLGRWGCTQGNDGPHTHQGLWRHGLDFEVKAANGSSFHGEGRLVEEYLCWKLPVLAMADGTVVRVVSDIPDNPIGEVTSAENWGNLVVVQHAPGRFSLVAHLAFGSVTVQKGALVRRGAVLGHCGNSGRSLVPHLHVQLQADDVVGSPTLPILFSDVVRISPDGSEHLRSRYRPGEGDLCRNLVRDESLASLCALPLGEPLIFLTHTAEGESRCTVAPEMDLLGNKRLLQRGSGELLWYEDRFGMFVIYDHIGSRASVPGLMRMAFPRLPFDATPGLSWSDSLILGQTRSTWRMWARDFVSPFLSSGGIAMEYTLSQHSDGWRISGNSTKRRRSGQPVVQTGAWLRPGAGLVELTARVDNEEIRAERILN